MNNIMLFTLFLIGFTHSFVTGQLVNKNGDGIPQVLIKNSLNNLSTLSDSNGYFSINVSDKITNNLSFEAQKKDSKTWNISGEPYEIITIAAFAPNGKLTWSKKIVLNKFGTSSFNKPTNLNNFEIVKIFGKLNTSYPQENRLDFNKTKGLKKILLDEIVLGRLLIEGLETGFDSIKISNINDSLGLIYRDSNGVKLAFIDQRDTTIYRMVKIGSQYWMSENLKYIPVDTSLANNTLCLDNLPSNCEKYGRFYDWATMMGVAEEYNSNSWSENGPIWQGICPSGWHLPDSSEWQIMTRFIDEENNNYGKDQNNWWFDVGQYLKHQSEWTGGIGNYGFDAIPSGYADYNPAWLRYDFEDSSTWFYMWIMNEIPTKLYIKQGFKGIGDTSTSKKSAISVRCLKN
jgi:uncharacterized protein (TIGR02145 family)